MSAGQKTISIVGNKQDAPEMLGEMKCLSGFHMLKVAGSQFAEKVIGT